MWKSTRICILALFPALLCQCHSDTTRAIPAETAAELLINRNWLNRWPTSKDDRLHVYRFVPTMGGGVYHDRTLYSGLFELFQFSVDEDRLRVYLPDRNEHVAGQFRIEEVDGPPPFDLRLTLSASPRGPKVYYGRRSETMTSLYEELPGFTEKQ